MKKIILIGRTGSGKTTLVQALNNYSIEYKKTQAVEFYNNIIDTPGEYIESRRFYNALIALSFDCDIIALVQDCSDDGCIFPPEFAAMFNKIVIGIVTKIDCKKGNINYAKECLYNAGVSKIFKVSSLKGSGLDSIKMFLF
ncbi:EutP/PduV family microcompartment system protein [Maledivibacter halophilus]|uniref:Ethanolamine utilization protein EutP n=1 Tax=Maledivibacter halophilus TaxID=36842 RepID=A0A1T5IFL1_9FIRM|nr:EutP/PduV family microcompartment system protein [Maledivibacter halophilus]SKC37890.1 ethanolamine utilization protein EutP [Maledivibacter halophilus]